MRNIVRSPCERGYRALDLGIDRTTTRGCFCKSDEPIFDWLHSAQPARQNSGGRDVSVNRAKHLVKHNPTLFQMAQKAASALHRSG